MDCPGHEDNLILDLAAEVGALLIVSNDTDLPGHGTCENGARAGTALGFPWIVLVGGDGDRAWRRTGSGCGRPWTPAGLAR